MIAIPSPLVSVVHLFSDSYVNSNTAHMQTVGEIDDSQSNLSTLLIVRSIEDCNGGGDYVHAETYGICKLGPKTALQSTFIRLDTCARDM